MIKNQSLTKAERYDSPLIECVQDSLVHILCGSPNEFTEGGGGYFEGTTIIDNGEY